jgi:hypothetical protein
LKRARAYVWKIDEPKDSSPPPDQELAPDLDTEEDSDAGSDQDERDRGKEIKNPHPKARRSNVNYYKARLQPVLNEAHKHYTETLYHEGFFPLKEVRNGWGAAAFRFGVFKYVEMVGLKRKHLLFLLIVCLSVSSLHQIYKRHSELCE